MDAPNIASFREAARLWGAPTLVAPTIATATTMAKISHRPQARQHPLFRRNTTSAFGFSTLSSALSRIALVKTDHNIAYMAKPYRPHFGKSPVVEAAE